MLEEGEIRPVQITVGPLKLSVEPVLSGPSIEFTDYETDISWLSGPPFINATNKRRASISNCTSESGMEQIRG